MPSGGVDSRTFAMKVRAMGVAVGLAVCAGGVPGASAEEVATAGQAVAGARGGGPLVNATLEDFFVPGTQQGDLVTPFFGPEDCAGCHGGSEGPGLVPIHKQWRGSLMSQSARDPVFYAELTLANQDVANAGYFCLRCHTPSGYLEGRVPPVDGSGLSAKDRQGIFCHVCHRAVDPVFEAGNPPRDQQILGALSDLPITFGNGAYVIDPEDYRRGPRSEVICDFFHTFELSPFHKEAALCGTCHDVSNPLFTRQPDGTYVAGPLDERHPTGDHYDMFPLQRTYTEWLLSDFAAGPIEMGGRFGGNRTAVSTCQDCHQPDATGSACVIDGSGTWDDVAEHVFVGANTWVLGVIPLIWPQDVQSGDVDPDALAAGQARNLDFLTRAATMELLQQGGYLRVRVINETGHKLPTGQNTGRRMWLNVKFLDDANTVIEERGAYDFDTATLTEDTKIYREIAGLSEDWAAQLGLPSGPSQRYALNNVILFDNRIPPRGFDNEAFEMLGAGVVGYTYDDGQYWDDSWFRVPDGAASVEVTLYYQTSTREHIEFLESENTTNNWGTVLRQAWEASGKAPPAVMNFETLAIGAFVRGDFDGDGDVDIVDFATLGTCFRGAGQPVERGCEFTDLDGDGDVDIVDFATFAGNFTGSQ